MLTTTRLATLVLIAVVTISLPGIAQTPRLWSYARYRVTTPTIPQLVDSGKFTYSGNRGLVMDTTNDFPFLFPRPDYTGLNAWYTHAHVQIAPRVVAQFDSFYQWRLNDSTASLQLFRTAVQTHQNGRIDSLQEWAVASVRTAYKWFYSTAGAPMDSREWYFSTDSGKWYRTSSVHLVRDSDGKPTVREQGAFDSAGALAGIVAAYYQYDSQNRFSVINTNLGLGIRERLEYDAQGRLRILNGEEADQNSNWMFILRDSFLYAGSSARCSRIYNLQRNGSSATIVGQHNYTYDAQGMLASYNGRNFQRNSNGYITQINETNSLGTFTTYFYYDSLGAASVPTLTASAVDFSIYPNPTANTIRVEGASPGAVYQILSLSGQKVSSGYITSRVADVSLRTLPASTYVFILMTPAGEQSIVRIVKH